MPARPNPYVSIRGQQFALGVLAKFADDLEARCIAGDIVAQFDACSFTVFALREILKQWRSKLRASIASAVGSVTNSDVASAVAKFLDDDVGLQELPARDLEAWGAMSMEDRVRVGGAGSVFSGALVKWARSIPIPANLPLISRAVLSAITKMGEDFGAEMIEEITEKWVDAQEMAAARIIMAEMCKFKCKTGHQGAGANIVIHAVVPNSMYSNCWWCRGALSQKMLKPQVVDRVVARLRRTGYDVEISIYLRRIYVLDGDMKMLRVDWA